MQQKHKVEGHPGFAKTGDGIVLLDDPIAIAKRREAKAKADGASSMQARLDRIEAKLDRLLKLMER
jgi:hypothetical protein